jgi:adenosylcobinamide-phosphate synthase
VVALAYGLNRCLVMGVADVWAFGGDSSVDWRLDGLQALILSVLLKPMFAWRMLWQEVSHVEQALGQSIAQGRQQLSRLVSRDVSALSEVQIRQAAISTLAENLNDSLVAPLFWFAVAGLPGAALYRFANTADAMWGYWGERGGRDWTWFGRWAAKVDDALSWLPARLSALMLLLVSGCTDWRKVMHAAAQTPSPNGGWPMGALAVAQGICLEKPGVYVLNAQGREPTRQDTEQAVVCCSRVGKMLACLFVLLGVFEWGWS